MLRQSLLHPPLLRALAAAGHGSRILLADANYPVSTAVAPRAEVVWLNVAPGLVDVLTLLELVAGAIPIEAAAVMQPDDGCQPEIFAGFQERLPRDIALERLDRSAFYGAARDEDVALAVATGEQRLFANLLLTVGVVPPES
jgi:L-fucose mutarotase